MKSKQYRRATWVYVGAGILALLAGFILPKSLAVRSLLANYQFLDDFSQYATKIARSTLRIDNCTMLSQYVDKTRPETRESHFGCLVFPDFIRKFRGTQVILVYVDTFDGTAGFAQSLVGADRSTGFVAHDITEVSLFAALDRRVAQMDKAIEILSWLAAKPGSIDQGVKTYYQAHLAVEMVSYQTAIFSFVIVWSLLGAWCLYRNVLYVREEKAKLWKVVVGVGDEKVRGSFLESIEELGLTTRNFEGRVKNLASSIQRAVAEDKAEAERRERMIQLEMERWHRDRVTAENLLCEARAFAAELQQAKIPKGVVRGVMELLKVALYEQGDLAARQLSISSSRRYFEMATRQLALLRLLEDAKARAALRDQGTSTYQNLDRHVQLAWAEYHADRTRLAIMEHHVAQAMQAARELKVPVVVPPN